MNVESKDQHCTDKSEKPIGTSILGQRGELSGPLNGVGHTKCKQEHDLV